MDRCKEDGGCKESRAIARKDSLESNMEENIILQCENSFVGILTGIYEAYALRIPHWRINLQIEEEGNLCLFSEYKKVEPDVQKAEKVSNTLQKKFGEKDFYTICLALASFSEKKAQAVYKTVVWGLSSGRRKNILGHLADDNVRTVMELGRQVENELHHLQGFLRFHELEGGILYAVMRPKSDIIMPLAEHFSDRLPMEDFLIYDEGRNQYAVHAAGKEWFMMQGESNKNGDDAVNAEEDMKRMQPSADDGYYQELFCRFCHTISIEARKNLKLQQNMLPLRFRPYMVEFEKREKCT